MKLNQLLVLTLATLSHISNIHAVELSNVGWDLSQEGVKDALLLLPEDNHYSEMVQLLREIEFDVQKEQVIEQRTVVNYFPRFVDTESYGTMGLYFDPNYQQVVIKTAASVSPSGVVKQITPSQIQLLNTGSYNTFSSQKELALAIPGLEEGSIAVLKYQVVTKRSMMEHDWAEELFTQQNYPIATYKLNVNWSNESPIFWSKDSEVIDCEQFNNTLDCQGLDIPAFEGDYQFLWRDGINRVSLGSLNSWQDVADLASTTMAAASTNQTGLDDLFLKLTVGAKSMDEKIERILAFVSRDIRYVSSSEFGHAMTPHDIVETIENRYGDCKDKSTLLLSLLKKLNLDPELVLVATNRNDPERVIIPSMLIFNHVIVCFEYDGQRYCVDPTDSQTHWQHTPAWVQGKVSLPLTARTQLEQVKKSPYRWKMHTQTKIVFDGFGGQKETQKRSYVGEYAAAVRSNLFELNVDDRLKKLTDEYHEVVSSIGNPEFRVENVNEMTEGSVIHSHATIEPFLTVGEELNYGESDVWIERELSDLKMFNELYPALFQGLNVTSTINYDTNNVWKITDVPPTLELIHPLGSLIRQVTLVSPTELSIKTELKVRSRMIEPEERESFNRMLSVFSEQSFIKFYGKAASKSPDAKL
ncbi:DUF3857 domain-containing protein [Vibrio sagamiensis]|uniref:DUF3857 domain-containing protein n=1 Tax=Vibrio sagamiensis NBRC 104589 TaxID=1219064 RepID=A0A511QJR3_9VIBR|nr:DUF3857 domain-containing protein [Vibrio sagamiensis]PNQ64033.1 DUF3857 domain-containing protein [Vibrio agarivorans]GEM77564.1 hypothetical protein VSA01S_36760 [Vibrio sagamiensis NBRC 104589]